jgi:peptidoglycan/LPS O-acetylase OafA/YrhL
MPAYRNLQLIQALRGIASLFVVLLHATVNASDILHTDFLFNAFKFGGAGVDIFFVISGFIITYTSLKSIGNPKNVFVFFRRRFVRIYPTYWIIISILLASQLLLPFFYKTHYDFNIKNLINTYFLLPDHIMVNGVSWTLTFELFFYFIFCLAFLIRNKKYTLCASLVYCIILVLLPFINNNYENVNSWISLITFPMNTEFVLGILAAVIVTRMPNKLNIPFIVIGSTIFICSAIISNFGYYLFNNSFNRVVLFGIPSFFIVSGIVNYEFGKKVLLPKALLNLGEASYSLYLLHLPIIVVAFRLLAKFNLKNIFIIHISIFLILAIICYGSIFFYNALEKPIINRLNSIRKIKVANEI